MRAQTAAAQVTSLGTTTSGPATNGGGRNDVAYDDKHDVFLHTWEDQGTIAGRFIDFDGTPRGDAFTIAVATQPMVVYARGAADDVFCVLASQSNGLIASFIRYTGTGPTGGASVGTPSTLTTTNVAGDAVFNPNTRRFLLAWIAPTGVALQHFDGSGQSADSVATITAEAPASEPFIRVDAVHLAYDWQQRKYMLTAEEVRRTDPTRGFTYTADVARVLDESTRLPVGPSVGVGLTFNAPLMGTSVAYLPEAGGFLTSFSHAFESVSGRFVPTANPAGAGASYPVMSGHFDTSATIEYDALSRRAFVVAHSNDLGNPTTYVGGALLDGSGQPVTAWTALRANTAPQSYRPHVRATRDGQFVVGYVNGGSAILERFSVPLASPAGPRFSHVSGHIDGPVNGATVGPSFLFGGWALDFGGSTGTGIDAVHGWAFPADGSPAIFLGADQIFHARGDLASLYGPHFTGTGFDINVNGLGAGTYILVAYARSTVSGAFAQVDALTVTVAAQPFMNLEAPSDGATVGTSFIVGGWALDLSAASGTTGVDAVHVWAFPTSGAAPIFVGADYGGSRPDVGAVFGPAFTNSGFHLDVTNFPPGSYYFVAYAHDTVTGTFSIQRGATVTVAAAAPPI